ncbi:hypothetical protein OG306_33430 [Streptomyces sp. NBC_01241]|uniref:hypothetical protein n=1 Tax=Streptomyces sp. NBC_01241 TaxID=2903794 RepID=UPI00352D92E0|nr:hypothetical protein OG306_33430 [Streptomyces sp. NBC_01241]
MGREEGLPGRQLVVSAVPGRKGKWLCTVNGPVFHSLAKFRDEDAVEEFFKWVTENEGKTLERGVDE